MARPRTTSSRHKFDDSRTITPRRRNVNTAGKSIHPGEPIGKDITDLAFRTRLYRTGRVVYLDEFNPVTTAKVADTDTDTEVQSEPTRVDDLLTEPAVEPAVEKAPTEPLVAQEPIVEKAPVKTKVAKTTKTKKSN